MPRTLDTLESLLHDARFAALDWSGERGGMASVKVEWNPYEAGWVAEANWSDNSRVSTEVCEAATDAVAELIDLLRRV